MMNVGGISDRDLHGGVRSNQPRLAECQQREHNACYSEHFHVLNGCDRRKTVPAARRERTTANGCRSPRPVKKHAWADRAQEMARLAASRVPVPTCFLAVLFIGDLHK